MGRQHWPGCFPPSASARLVPALSPVSLLAQPLVSKAVRGQALTARGWGVGGLLPCHVSSHSPTNIQACCSWVSGCHLSPLPRAASCRGSSSPQLFLKDSPLATPSPVAFLHVHEEQPLKVFGANCFYEIYHITCHIVDMRGAI